MKAQQKIKEVVKWVHQHSPFFLGVLGNKLNELNVKEYQLTELYKQLKSQEGILFKRKQKSYIKDRISN